MSTLALETSGEAREGGRGTAAAIARYSDLVLLTVALPIFVVAGFSMLGYAAAAAAWIAQHVLLFAAERHAASALERGDRRRAMGTIGVATLGRVWLVTLTILLVGVLGSDDAGLAAAVLCAALVTVHLASVAFGKLLGPEEAA